MKSLPCLTTILFLYFSFPSASFAQQNLLLNPGFENGTISPFEDKVSKGDLFLENNPAHVKSGAYALKHQSTAADSYTLPWFGKVIASYSGAQTYELSAWVKANSPNTSVQMYLFSLDQNYQTTPSTRTSQNFVVGTTWQKITLSYTCPANRKFVSIRLDLNTSSRTVWWDDLSLMNKNTGPEALKMEFASGNNNDDNFRLSGAFGFSASKTANDEYRIYATASHGGIKWNNALNGIESLFFANNPDRCPFDDDPRNWDSRCLEHIGLFSKSIPCNNGNACEQNDRWNGYPGANNVSTFTDPNLWPKRTDYGTLGYQDILGKDQVHDVQFVGGNQMCNDNQWCPPKTGFSNACFVSNPDEYATGVSNPKVTEVVYPNGQKRWFMAFNIQLRNLDHPQGKLNGADIWQAGWAWSMDGKTWNIHDRFLFRNVQEDQEDPCSIGFLLNNMFVDDEYFYLLFNTVGNNDLLMARSQISATPPTIANNQSGYNLNGQSKWEISSGTDANGNHLWKSIDGNTDINTQTIFNNGARNIFAQNLGNDDRCFLTRQVDIAKVYLSNKTDSPYRYIALVSEKSKFNNTCDPANPVHKLYLYSANDLSKRFTIENEVDISNIPVGLFGQEFSFTHDANHRILADQIDLWMVQKLVNPAFPNDAQSTVTISRKTMTLSGQIFSNGTGDPITDLTAPVVKIEAPGFNHTVSGNNISVRGWALDAFTVDQLTLEIDDIPRPASFSRTVRQGVCNSIDNFEIGDPDCPMVGWQTTMNSLNLSNGRHVLKITGIDPSGNRGSRKIPFFVDNVVTDNVKPLLAIDVPSPNQTLSGDATLSGWAIDASSVDVLQIHVDNVEQNNTFTRVGRGDVCNHQVNDNVNDPDCPTVGWETELDTRNFSNDTHTLRITATDAFGNSKFLDRQFVIDNPIDNTNPKVWVDYPFQGADVNGIITVHGWAIDASSVDRFEFFIDNGLQNQIITRENRGDVCAHEVNDDVNDPDCPAVGWTTSFNTNNFSNGTHIVKITAFDPSDNWSSQSRQFTISNNSNLAAPSNTLNFISSSTPVFTPNFKLYPNPFNDKIHTTYHLTKTAMVGFRLTSLEGKVLQSMDTSRQTSGIHTLSIDTNNHPPGIYFATLFIDGEQFSTKIIKTK